MRNILTFGALSLAMAAGIAACGDDDGDDGPSGTGGTAGRGGTGGTGGATGGTGGATGGAGGSGGAAQLPGPLATCTGCVELIAPLTGPNDGAVDTTLADQIAYQFSFATPVDFSDGVVTWTVAAVAPNVNTFVQLFAQNGQALGFAGAYLTFALDPVLFPANEFREIVIDVAALAAAPGDAGVPDAGEPPVVVVDAGADAGDASVPATAPTVIGAFDKSLITALGITIGVGDTFTGSTVLRVAVDEVGIAGVPGQAARTFTAGVDTLGLNNFQNLAGMQAPVHHP
jgi:hypothetical protein